MVGVYVLLRGCAFEEIVEMGAKELLFMERFFLELWVAWEGNAVARCGCVTGLVVDTMFWQSVCCALTHHV